MSEQDLEGLVARWAALDDEKKHIESEQASIKQLLIDALGVGASKQIAGLKVTVSAPSRRFNLEKAKTFLTPEQIKLATIEQLDAAKVKGFLPPVMLDAAMDPGTGAPIVRIS